MGKFRKQE